MRSALFFLLALAFTYSPAFAENKVDPDIERAPIDTRANRENLIGNWYLSQPTNKGGVWRVLSSLSADGSYISRFEEYLDGRLVRKYSEEGLWGVSGDIHFTIRQVIHARGRSFAAPQDQPENYVAYRVVELDASSFTYESVVSANRFQSSKVPEGFEFPDPY